MERTLGQQMVRTAGIFQGLTALPVMLCLGEWAFEILWSSYYTSVYLFITSAVNGLEAAGIVYILLVQRYAKTTKISNYYLEIAKFALACSLWLWLLFDAIFHTRQRDYYGQPGDYKLRRIINASLCFFLLPVLFYPTLHYAIVQKRSGDRDATDEEQTPTGIEGEREPLLGAAPR